MLAIKLHVIRWQAYSDRIYRLIDFYLLNNFLWGKGNLCNFFDGTPMSTIVFIWISLVADRYTLAYPDKSNGTRRY